MLSSSSERLDRSVLLTITAYGVVTSIVLALILVVIELGKKLEIGGAAPVPSSVAHAYGATPLFQVLVALVSIIALGRIVGRAFIAVGQPRVMGEIVAGIMLGPSLLGYFSPAAMYFVLPPEVMPLIGIIAQVGIILYMFLVGLELNAELLRSRAHSTIAISHTSILVPFFLGTVLALVLYGRYSPADAPFTSFALFMGIAMSITAFPVLARILSERKLDCSHLGVVALSCAAVDDVTAWCILAFVVGIVQAEVGGAVQTIFSALAYIAVMMLLVRPMAEKYLVHDESKGQRNAVWVLIALLLSAMATELIGVHALFGAFLLGAIIPHDSNLAKDFCHKLEDVVQILLLPAFFAYTGMRTEIGLMYGWDIWAYTVLIIFVATLGKFGGTYAAARFTGFSPRTCAALGILMNTRGLMQLIVLNIGLEMGVLSPELFAMMVVMALVTTLATTPVLDRLTTPVE